MFLWTLVAAAAVIKAQSYPNSGSGESESDPSTIGATVSPQGVTEIFSENFGRQGVNVTYDYIIVGGGNAGNTIAARLALDPANFSIAIVEAGSFYEIVDGNRTQIPGYDYINTLDYPIGQVSTPTAIGLHTTPQSGFSDREIFYLTAQTFGGGTATNYMGYHRPTVGSLDMWAELVDDDFWSWNNSYPAYKKSCKFTPPDYSKIPREYNITWDPSSFDEDGGPLQISFGNFIGPSAPFIGPAMEKAGIKRIQGINSGKLIGYGTIAAAIDSRTATRSSSETSFLQLAARGSNIQIYPDTLVKRITFDGQKRANGVDVQANSATVNLKYHLTARKEVILSAGAWHSPQILMVSGVGPAETLQKFDIDVVVDLPGVGQNEWDQAVVPLVLATNVSTNTQFQAGNPEVVAQVEFDYYHHQSGILSGLGTSAAVGFEKFPEPYRSEFNNSTLKFLDTFPADWPEVEYAFLENAPITTFKELLGDIPTDLNILVMSGVLLTTKSRGNMTISSADILDQPIISPNWLTDADGGDLEQAYTAFRRMREIAFNSSIVTSEILPGSQITERGDIISFLQNNMTHIFHAASTCKMGTANDTSAVVDSRGRVFGVTGLRVVDASAFPIMPPGHPMSSVYMLAEKLAESILQGD